MVITQPIAEVTAAKHYDDQGFLVTNGAALASPPSPTPVAEKAAVATDTSAPSQLSKVSAASRAALGFQEFGFLVSAVCSILGGIVFVNRS